MCRLMAGRPAQSPAASSLGTQRGSLRWGRASPFAGFLHSALPFLKLWGVPLQCPCAPMCRCPSGSMTPASRQASPAVCVSSSQRVVCRCELAHCGCVSSLVLDQPDAASATPHTCGGCCIANECTCKACARHTSDSGVLPAEVLGSLKCDCAEQLQLSMQYIQEAGCGIIIYLQQEGRGIGLANKIAAYALQVRAAEAQQGPRPAACGIGAQQGSGHATTRARQSEGMEEVPAGSLEAVLRVRPARLGVLPGHGRTRPAKPHAL